MVDIFWEHFVMVARGGSGGRSLVLPAGAFRVMDTNYKSLSKTGSLS